MNTLQGMQEGAYRGAKEITLSEGLDHFPNELFSLVDTLEKLDLSENNISELPDEIREFKFLKIIFLSKNKFKVFPKQLANCPSLTMVGLKSNAIEFIPENAFPKKLQWLILTDNQLSSLPNSIGENEYLQKCALAGNRIKELPSSMQRCKRLELLRISANQLQEIPLWLFELPRLTWLAFSGNPCAPKIPRPQINSFHWDQLTVKEQLGQGASGDIYQAIINQEHEVAIKIFKGEITSDGYAEDEQLTWMYAQNHPNLVSIVGEIMGHPDSKKGIIMNLVDTSFRTLAKPPSFLTCTRDVYDNQLFFKNEQAINLLKNIAFAANYLHTKGIMHGDLYAHNILFNEDGVAFLGDFGAATYYDKQNLQASYFEQMDVRAFGCLLEEVARRTELLKNNSLMHRLIYRCMHEDKTNRPLFHEIIEELDKICTSLYE